MNEPDIKDIVPRLRQRLRRGLFATYITMEEAADQITMLRANKSDLEHQLHSLQDRYNFVLEQWMAERLISDNLYTDLVSIIHKYNSSNDTSVSATEYMDCYRNSRDHGVIAI